MLSLVKSPVVWWESSCYIDSNNVDGKVIYAALTL